MALNGTWWSGKSNFAPITYELMSTRSANTAHVQMHSVHGMIYMFISPKHPCVIIIFWTVISANLYFCSGILSEKISLTFLLHQVCLEIHRHEHGSNSILLQPSQERGGSELQSFASDHQRISVPAIETQNANFHCYSSLPVSPVWGWTIKSWESTTKMDFLVEIGDVSGMKKDPVPKLHLFMLFRGVA